eukprot:6493385-Ditylum_brightwellii.AAC.1
MTKSQSTHQQTLPLTAPIQDSNPVCQSAETQQNMPSLYQLPIQGNDEEASESEYSISSDSNSSETDSDTEGGKYLIFEPSIPKKNSSDDLLGKCDPPDIDNNDFLLTSSVNSFEIGIVHNDEEEITPTTNAADTNVEIQTETVYDDENNEFMISGS